MEFFSKIITSLLNKSAKTVVHIGPNTMGELLKQFDEPPKQKTPEDIVRDYQVKETMAALEVDMLKMDPSLLYRGTQMWFDGDGNKYFDFVPCVLRPEVLYCAYGKN
jgi:hypothetical protein